MPTRDNGFPLKSVLAVLYCITHSSPSYGNARQTLCRRRERPRPDYRENDAGVHFVARDDDDNKTLCVTAHSLYLSMSGCLRHCGLG